MSVLEAQAAGLAAVVGDVGAMSSIIRAPAGTLVKGGDAAAFRGAVAAYFRLSAKIRAAMSEAVSAKAWAFHDLPFATDQLDRVLEAAVARATKRRR
jgi:glycosyltransferase involved in cell wall biosynthesis